MERINTHHYWKTAGVAVGLALVVLTAGLTADFVPGGRVVWPLLTAGLFLAAAWRLSPRNIDWGVLSIGWAAGGASVFGGWSAGGVLAACVIVGWLLFPAPRRIWTAVWAAMGWLVCLVWLGGGPWLPLVAAVQAGLLFADGRPWWQVGLVTAGLGQLAWVGVWWLGGSAAVWPLVWAAVVAVCYRPPRIEKIPSQA